jgi:hypothetical protein
LIADATPAQRELKLHTLDIVGWRAGGHGYLAFSRCCRRFLPFQNEGIYGPEFKAYIAANRCWNGTKRRSPALRRQHGVLNGQ